MENNKKEEIKFQIEMELVEIGKQNNPKRTIKLAQKNLKKMLFNRINGKTGEC
ncbi:MAG: hypothetical protein PHX34_00420 [Candidatus Shapirobacteria bacterium]|nr:hypothetical protein [Candidatus Shapirobacteria bacterium]